MADDKFKLPGSSYEELTKIVKSYGQFSVPAGLDEVSKLTGMDKTVISRNAGFLIEMNILESGQKKSLTSLGKDLAQALEHEMPEEIRKGWQQIVEVSDFSTKLISAIKIRNGMDENTLQSHIAYSAGQPKKPQFMTGAKTLIDILRASELVKENDGKYVVVKPIEVDESSQPHQMTKSTEAVTTNPSQISVPVAVSSAVVEKSGAVVKININVSVECTVEELDGLGDKIKNIIKQVNTEETDEEILPND